MELKQWKNIFHVIVNANSMAHVIQIQKLSVKIITHAEKIIFGILAHAFVRIFKKYLKSIGHTSVIECDKIVSVADIVST